MFQKMWHSDALKLFCSCRQSVRNMTFHHMGHLCKGMGTKCTVMRSHKYRTQRKREFLMCNESMTFADTSCDHAFSLVHGMGRSKEVEVLLAPLWRRPTPGGKETWNIFLPALCLFLAHVGQERPIKPVTAATELSPCSAAIKLACKKTREFSRAALFFLVSTNSEKGTHLSNLSAF